MEGGGNAGNLGENVGNQGGNGGNRDWNGGKLGGNARNKGGNAGNIIEIEKTKRKFIKSDSLFLLKLKKKRN